MKTLLIGISLFLFSIEFIGQTKRLKLPEECDCETISRLLELHQHCDTIFSRRKECWAHFSERDTINGIIFFRARTNVSVDKEGNLYANKYPIKQWERTREIQRKDTTVQETYEWFKSPYTRKDTLVLVEETITYSKGTNPLTGEREPVTILQPYRFCGICIDYPYENYAHLITIELEKNIRENNVAGFVDNIQLLYSHIAMDNKRVIADFYEIGRLVEKSNEEMAREWLRQRERLLDYLRNWRY